MIDPDFSIHFSSDACDTILRLMDSMHGYTLCVRTRKGEEHDIEKCVVVMDDEGRDRLDGFLLDENDESTGKEASFYFDDIESVYVY